MHISVLRKMEFIEVENRIKFLSSSILLSRNQKRMISYKYQDLLSHFKEQTTPPVLKSYKDKKTFEVLQRLNLIRATFRGDFHLTDEGKMALKMGVDNYIEMEKMEKELTLEAPGLKRKSKFLVICLILLFLLNLFLIFKIEELTLGDHFIEKIWG